MLAFGTLAGLSWRKWPDPLIDFGRELYVPWQLTRGAMLYRDIASLFGPLSPHVNALWFRLFGVSLMTLAWCNLAIFAAMVAGIHRLIRTATDAVTASAAGLTTIVLFGFSQYVPVGNYNFVTPYSHEATHGLALAVATFVSLHHGLISRRLRWFAVAGIAFGLLNLTKPEIVVASAAGVVSAFAIVSLVRAREPRWLLTGLLVFAAAAVVPPLAFLIHFARGMPMAQAARAVGGAWASLDARMATDPFYLAGSGLDAPVANAARMLFTFAGFVAFVAGGIWAAPSRQRRLVLLAIAVLAVSRGTTPRALPLIALTSLATAVVLTRAAAGDPEQALRRAPLVTWSAFGLVLLGKIVLNARIVHYGFYLALPAATAAVALVCWAIPQWLASRKQPQRGDGFRQIALWTLAACAAPYVGLSYGWYAMKTVPVGAGGDRFLAADGPGQWQGRAVNEALAVLQRESPADATIAVLPEGVMLNYLLRRQSPLPVVTAMPPEIAAFGEDTFVAALDASPPAFVVLVRKDTAEYGVPPFGTSPRYGAKIRALVTARYKPVRSIDDGNIEILDRR